MNEQKSFLSAQAKLQSWEEVIMYTCWEMPGKVTESLALEHST